MLSYRERMYAANLAACGGVVPEEIRLAVKRGAALLDEQRPGWWMVIDLDELRLNRTNECVLGQLFAEPVTMPRWRAYGHDSLDGFVAQFASMTPGWAETEGSYEVCEANYAAGKVLLGLNDDACVEHGFLRKEPDLGVQRSAYAALDVAWADVVLERRGDGV
jgi:hypothetical protein